jgi:SNF2 family DNA or RNA helicase
MTSTPNIRAFCELSEDGRRIEVYFRYSADAVAAVKRIAGRRFVGDANPKHWTIPADMISARRLREEFGDGLQLGDAVQAWGKEQARQERAVAKLNNADDATLKLLDKEAAKWLRPYQRADVAMMAATNVLNANQPGVGKTVEVIYAAQEAGLAGPHLVIAPITLHKDPWANELEAHAPDARVFWGSTPAERKQAVKDAAAAIAAGEPNVWLIVNPDMIRTDKNPGDEDTRPVLSRDHKGNVYVAKPEVASLFTTEWATLTLDEFHKYGLGADRNTLFARAVKTLGERSQRRYALSGTPMGGKPIRLYGVLNFVEPQLYPSKWRWAEQWLEISDNGYGKKIGGLLPGREASFYEAHGKHMIRRNRADVLPGLPPKVVLDVRVPMSKKQERMYREFERSASVAVEGGQLVADAMLAEFARLKQLANALCRVDDQGVVWPTTDSGKLPILLDRLDTHGVGPADTAEPGARAIVASESQRFVKVVCEWLVEQGINARRLDGTVTGAKRDAVIDWYKEDADEARVLVMTTQTGGVGLNLGMTGSMHILDETWNPDDQEQLEDRGMRNRTTPLNILYYRTDDTIQRYIQNVGAGKRLSNRQLLDLRGALLGG